MPVYDANEWYTSNEPVHIDIDERHHIEISVSCTKEVQLLGLVNGERKIPLHIGKQFRIRSATKGFEALQLKGVGKTYFGYRVREMPRQDGEALNNENPPSPPMPGTDDNLVLKLQKMVRQQAREHRMPVMEPEGDGFEDRYGIEDDDEDFEEEIFLAHVKAKKDAKIAEAKEAADLASEKAEPTATAEEPPQPVHLAAE